LNALQQQYFPLTRVSWKKARANGPQKKLGRNNIATTTIQEASKGGNGQLLRPSFRDVSRKPAKIRSSKAEGGTCRRNHCTVAVPGRQWTAY
jgi:hypothetical protein